MDKPQIRQTLEQLHAELEHTQSMDEETRERLKHLMTDIHNLLEESDQPSGARAHSLNDRLGDALLELQVAHPHLALTVERIVDAFNEVGI